MDLKTGSTQLQNPSSLLHHLLAIGVRTFLLASVGYHMVVRGADFAGIQAGGSTWERNKKESFALCVLISKLTFSMKPKGLFCISRGVIELFHGTYPEAFCKVTLKVLQTYLLQRHCSDP